MSKRTIDGIVKIEPEDQSFPDAVTPEAHVEDRTQFLPSAITCKLIRVPLPPQLITSIVGHAVSERATSEDEETDSPQYALGPGILLDEGMTQTLTKIGYTSPLTFAGLKRLCEAHQADMEARINRVLSRISNYANDIPGVSFRWGMFTVQSYLHRPDGPWHQHFYNACTDVWAKYLSLVSEDCEYIIMSDLEEEEELRTPLSWQRLIDWKHGMSWDESFVQNAMPVLLMQPNQLEQRLGYDYSIRPGEIDWNRDPEVGPGAESSYLDENIVHIVGELANLAANFEPGCDSRAAWAARSRCLSRMQSFGQQWSSRLPRLREWHKEVIRAFRDEGFDDVAERLKTVRAEWAIPTQNFTYCN